MALPVWDNGSSGARGEDGSMRRVCVFCGSRVGARPVYLEAARDLGHALVERGYGLVYGGASVGLMGAIADAVLEGGGEVIGVIPRALVERELSHPGLHELHVVETMHARKALMAAKSDAFIAMPGGFGTFEELFEVVTWGQIGIHRKPMGLLDVAGYFDALMAMVDRAVEEGFVPETHRDLVCMDPDPQGLLERLGHYRLPELGRKWADRTDI